MLLQTKLHPPPQRPGALRRQRLVELLQQAVARRVTLVSAPAGYGKTTLVATWLTHQPLPAAWLSLDPYDNDASRFLSYLSAALTQLDPRVGTAAREMLAGLQVGSPGNLVDPILTSLANDLLTLEFDHLIVLDDLHVLHDEELLTALAFWIDHLPPQTHLLLLSRRQPRLPLARWRVRGQLLDIGTAELQFSSGEADQFLRNVMQITLPTALIETLVQRTEGWAASLQLAALSLRDQADPQAWVAGFSGRDRQIVDYLLNEVFEQQPADLQQFLLQTAIVNRLSIPLAQTLSEDLRAADFLERLQRRNLFIEPLDSEYTLYRYHPLFAEFLGRRFEQLDPVGYRAAHQRASRWFSECDQPDLALQHAVEAADWERAGALLVDHGPTLIWHEGRPGFYIDLCQLLPSAALLAVPQATILLGWAYVFQGRFAELEQHLGVLKAAFGPLSAPPLSELKGSLAILQGELAVWSGSIPEALGYFDLAFELLPADLTVERAIARQVQGYAYRLQGEIDLAQQALEEAVQLADDSINPSLRMFAGCDLAETHLMAGRVDAAERAIHQTLSYYPDFQREQLVILNLAYIVMAKCQLLQNRLREAERSLSQATKMLDAGKMQGPIQRYGAFQRARLQLAQGDLPAVEKMVVALQKALQESQNSRADATLRTRLSNFLVQTGRADLIEFWEIQQRSTQPRYQQHEEKVARARYLVATRQAAAEPLLNEILAAAQAHGWVLLALESHILQAIYHHRAGEEVQALDALQRAIALSKPRRLIRPFIDEGEPLARLLRLALTKAIEPAFIGQLQAAFLPASVATQPLIDPLTQRELEVLALLADGLSNPEIAEQMIVATGTIAKYTNNIYAKLGVRNRTEAAARGRQLGLV